MSDRFAPKYAINAPSVAKEIAVMDRHLSKLDDRISLAELGHEELTGDTDERIEHIEKELQRTPLMGLRGMFKCGHCEGKEMISVRIKCNHCDKETWWGWRPKP